MSAFNLTPDPAVMIVQAGVFMTGIVIVNKLYLQPYLKVRTRREALTTGSKAHAEELLEKNKQIAAMIASKASAAQADVAQMREQKIHGATSQKQKIVSGAEQEAKSTIESMRSQIAQEIKSAKAELGGVVKKVADEMYQEVLG